MKHAPNGQASPWEQAHLLLATGNRCVVTVGGALITSQILDSVSGHGKR